MAAAVVGLCARGRAQGAGPLAGAVVEVLAAPPSSGWTPPALERLLVRRGGGRSRPADGPRGDSRPAEPPCGTGRPSVERVVATLDPPDRLALEGRGSGCILARVEVAFERERPEASVDRALAALVRALATPSTASPSPAPPEPTGPPSSGDELAAADRRASIAALAGCEPRLADAVRRRIHLRHREGADGSDGFVDGPGFARALQLEVFGVDLGSTLHALMGSGPSIAFSEAEPERDLVPGDLLFTTSFAGFPRSVMVYLGRRKQAEAAPIRGVFVGEVPRSVPNASYVRAVRPARRPATRAEDGR